MTVREKFIDRAGNHGKESRLFFGKHGAHVNVDQQPRHHHTYSEEMNDHRPRDNGRADQMKAHDDPADHDQRNHHVHQDGEKLLPGVVNTLRRQLFLGAANHVADAYQQPAHVVPVEGNFLLQDFLAQVGLKSKCPIHNKYDRPSQADRNVEMQHVGARTEDALHDLQIPVGGNAEVRRADQRNTGGKLQQPHNCIEPVQQNDGDVVLLDLALRHRVDLCHA